MKGYAGQAATEYLALIGMILIATIPIFYYVNEQVESNTRMNQANDAVSILANAADSNYAWVSIPSGVKSVSIAGTNENIILLKLSIFGGVSDFTAQSKAKLTAKGDLLNTLSKKGIYKVSLKAEEDKVELEISGL